jgi:hypothetical protein
MNLFELEEGVSRFLKLTATDTFTSKNWPEGIPYFDVIDLSTGEEGRLWIDGGLKGQLSTLGGVEKAVGMQLEILKGPQKAIEVDGEKVKVNTYQLWELN